MDVIYVKTVTNRTGKEDVILIEKGEDRRLQRGHLTRGQVNEMRFRLEKRTHEI